MGRVGKQVNEYVRWRRRARKWVGERNVDVCVREGSTWKSEEAGTENVRLTAVRTTVDPTRPLEFGVGLIGCHVGWAAGVGGSAAQEPGHARQMSKVGRDGVRADGPAD